MPSVVAATSKLSSNFILKSFFFTQTISSPLCNINPLLQGKSCFFPSAPHHAFNNTLVVGLLASATLMVSSIRGKIRIVHNDDEGRNLNEPLINEKPENNPENKRESLYTKANLFNLVTFSWLNPLFVIGNQKPLENDEIPELDLQDSAAFLSQSLDKNLKQVMEETGGEISTASIYKAMYRLGWKKAALNATFASISTLASYVGPYLINDFVDFLDDKKHKSLKTGYLLAVSFFGAKVIEITAQKQWVFGARQLGLRLRAALISHIYQKGLVLSSQARQCHTSGEIINYMSVDVQRITDFAWYINTAWMLPIQISLAIFVLDTNLGFGSLAGLTATLIVMSCNIPLTTVKQGALLPLILLAHLSFEMLQIASNYWVAWACPTSSDEPAIAGMGYVLLVYGLVSVIGSLFILVRSMVTAKTGLLTAQKFFKSMLHSVMRAPMSFFDSYQ